MLIDFEDKDYNTLILTFDKNSGIDTFESNIKEAEELGFKYCLEYLLLMEKIIQLIMSLN